MRAICQQQCPGLLANLTLSESFITRWVRDALNWRWRASTTAASKLPLDWEDQGIRMAMRMAALMSLHQVSPQKRIRMEFV
jgi:hypothetical protein